MPRRNCPRKRTNKPRPRGRNSAASADRSRGRAFGVLLVLVAAICACGGAREETLEACASYASRASDCLGQEVGERLRASFAKAPQDPRARAALNARCAEQNARVRLACR